MTIVIYIVIPGFKYIWMCMYVHIISTRAYGISFHCVNKFNSCKQQKFAKQIKIFRHNSRFCGPACMYIHTYVCIFCLGIIKILLSFESHVTYGWLWKHMCRPARMHKGQFYLKILIVFHAIRSCCLILFLIQIISVIRYTTFKYTASITTVWYLAKNDQVHFEKGESFKM